MNKKILLVLAVFLLAVGIVYAGVAVEDDGTYEGETVKINFVDSSVSFSGDTATVDTSVMASATITAATIGDLAATGTINLSNSGDNITILSKALTASGTDLFWAGNKLTN